MPSPGETAPDPPVVPQMAAAVVPMRDGSAGLEVLVGQRTSKARFMGGFWVFPGGRVEPEDGPGDAGYRRAAARELREEVGLTVHPDGLVPFDRWLTPEPLPRRFDTVFYLGQPDPDEPVAIDGEEIVDGRWERPARLLEASAAQTMVVSFPTLRQLEKLLAWSTVAEALAACAENTLEPVMPVIGDHDGPVLVIPGPDGRPRRFRAGELHRGEAESNPDAD